MPFAPESRAYSDTRKRTSSSYVKFSPAYRVVLRILDENARLAWKHWIPEANAGKGMMATCPNTATERICPIDSSLAGLDKEDPKYIDRKAKKRYIANVLDRTPYTVCDSCGTETPGKACIACQADLKKHTFTPLNRIKILESGPQLFTTTLNAVENMQAEEFDGAGITDYDITFSATGVGRDRKIAAIPAAPSPISEADLIDPETGEPQKAFRLDDLLEPSTVEEIEAMLKGATIADLNVIRGIV